MPEVYLRRCEVYTAKRSSDPVKIDVGKLRECSPPYMGNTTKELMEYLEEHVFDSEKWYEKNKVIYPDCRITGEELDMENDYFDSRTKGSNEWMEVGKPNERMSKNGYFETLESNEISTSMVH